MRGDSQGPSRGSQRPIARRAGPLPLARIAAFVLPFVGAVWLTRGDALWRSDAAVLSSLADVHSFQGALSSLLSRAFLFFPFGSQTFRLALPGAFAAGLAGLFTLQLSHWLFRKQGGHSRLDPWLALGASLSLSFSLPWMQEATVAGGAAVGAALALYLLTALLREGLPRTLHTSLAGGFLLGLLFAESSWCAALLAISALVVWPESQGLRRLRMPAAKLPSFSGWQNTELNHGFKLLALFFGAALGLGLVSLPAFLAESTNSLSALAQASRPENSWPLWSPLGWASSIGFLWCAGALIAALFALSDRRPVYALTLLILADLLAPGSSKSGWTEALEVDENRLALHLLALGVVAPLGALGLRTLGETAQALKLFAARPLAAMVAVLAVAGCLASAEDSLRTLQQSGTSGTQAWTDEALEALPHRALIITHSPAWGRRLLAAQAQSERPDILIVPLNNIGRVGTLKAWLDKEPALEYLLRDLSTSDVPSERALTRLIDERPVYFEADPSWDKRLLAHLIPAMPLVGFSPHAVAHSDRRTALDTTVAPRRRIQKASEAGLTPELVTPAQVESSFEALALTFQALRDKRSQAHLKELLPQKQAPKSPEAKETKALAPLAALNP